MQIKKKILLIDDDVLVLESLAKILKRDGYDITRAEDGFEAFEKIKESHFDLIICDIRMPGMNGIDTLLKIRDYLKRSGRSPIPEIILTGYAESQLKKKSFSIGVSEYIYKPFDIVEFSRKIKNILSKH